jgi:hypothetical protein
MLDKQPNLLALPATVDAFNTYKWHAHPFLFNSSKQPYCNEALE